LARLVIDTAGEYFAALLSRIERTCETFSSSHETAGTDYTVK
jgi:hypothetical protein